MKKHLLAALTDPKVAPIPGGQANSESLKGSAYWVKSGAWLSNPASD
jgi:hypothetical protein